MGNKKKQTNEFDNYFDDDFEVVYEDPEDLGSYLSEDSSDNSDDYDDYDGYDGDTDYYDDYYDDDFDDDYDDEGISDDTRNVDEFDDYFDDDDFDSFDDYNIKKEKRKKGDTFEMDFIDLD